MVAQGYTAIVTIKWYETGEFMSKWNGVISAIRQLHMITLFNVEQKRTSFSHHMHTHYTLHIHTRMNVEVFPFKSDVPLRYCNMYWLEWVIWAKSVNDVSLSHKLA